MKRVVAAVLVLFLAVAFVGQGEATVRERVRSAARVTVKTTKTTVRAIERGTKKAAVAVKNRVKKAGRKVKAAAKKAGHAIMEKTTRSGHSKGPNQGCRNYSGRDHKRRLSVSRRGVKHRTA
jgi:hypothetical protein